MRATIWTLATLALLGSAQAAAQSQCAAPDMSLTIPEGANATEAQMLAAQSRLVELDTEVSEYLRCVRGEASQQGVGKSEEERTRLAQIYVDAHNASTIQLAGLLDCFNAQVPRFQENGGGSGAQAANCTSFLTAAANPESRPAPGGTPQMSSLVKEADGPSTQLEDGAWGFMLIRDEAPRRCDTQACLSRTVVVTNTSSKDLECRTYIQYDGADVDGRQRVERRSLVSAGTRHPVLTSLAPMGVSATVFDSECVVRAPLPELKVPPKCRYEVVKSVNISDYYPEAARERDEQGAVVVEFALRSRAGNPTDVKVVASSLSDDLDRGAIEAVQAMEMSSSCGRQRYRLRLNFQLE